MKERERFQSERPTLTHRVCERIEGTGSLFLSVLTTAATRPPLHLGARPNSNRMPRNKDEVIEGQRRGGPW
jgi:hypothetical protein